MDNRNIWRIEINYNIYQYGKIYKICSKQTDKIYVGSTTQTIEHRFFEHKTTYHQYQKNKRNYLTSFEIIKFGDAYVELIENFPTDNKNDLRTREKFYIENNNCVNQNIPIRTPEEIQAQNKQWYEQNKNRQIDKQREKDKIEIKCDCGGKYRHSNKADHLKTKKHLRFIKKQNKNQICNETYFNCPCGGQYKLGRVNKYQHEKTEMHLNYLNNQTQPLCIEIKKQNQPTSNETYFNCPCGGQYKPKASNKYQHGKTAMHLNYLKNLNEQ